MIKSGIKRIRHDHRDYDLHRTYGTTGLPQLPDTFTVDAGLWIPDQELPNALFTPVVPALPFGCTDYSQADLCSDQHGCLLNPMSIEDITHANAKGGADIRDALNAARQLGWISTYFRITQAQGMDWFDTLRAAMWLFAEEKRGVSIGTPWLPEFTAPGVHGELPVPIFDLKRASWHNWVICGWDIQDGQTYLVGKSLQGANYGDKGFHRVSRPLLNALMNIYGSAAFTMTNKAVDVPIQTVELNRIISFIKNVLHIK